ncbi:hypothetical protein C8Q74DRAFT_325216 [Fomes fomentarius]|nr:hypothetical protein C8Q74DRAFT_325216 [Fomes fomentarius]
MSMPSNEDEQAVLSGQKMEIDPKDETRVPTWATTSAEDFFRSLTVEPILGRSEDCRKRAEQDEAPTENKEQRTKGRRRRGWGELVRVLNLPPELLLEIMSHLHPKNLLNMTRANKFLYGMTMRNRGVWNNSFALVDGLPPRPDNVSGPYYASLLFERRCMACGQTGHANRVDYALLIRFCNACKDANYSSGTDMGLTSEPHTRVALTLLPVAIHQSYVDDALRKVEPDSHELGDIYYVPMFRAVLQYLHSVPVEEVEEVGKKDFNKRKAWVFQRQNHAIELNKWEAKMTRKKAEEAREIIEKRKIRITEKLEGLGYTIDDFPVNNKAWQKFMGESKEVTERVWVTLCPKLKELLAEEQQRRAKAKFKEDKDRRLKNIGKYYEAFTMNEFTPDERVLLPHNNTALKFPVLDNLAEKEGAQKGVRREDFYDAREELRERIEEYKTHFKRRLAVKFVYKAAYKTGYIFSPINGPSGLQTTDELLAHPMALFECSYHPCNIVHRELLVGPYQACHTHLRQEHPSLCLNVVLGKDEDVSDPAKDSLNSVVVYDMGFELVAKILLAAGLSSDKWNLTQDGLTALVQEGRLYCACGDPSMLPPMELSWGDLVKHVHQHYSWYKDRRMVNTKQMRTPGYAEARHLVYLDNHVLPELPKLQEGGESDDEQSAVDHPMPDDGPLEPYDHHEREDDRAEPEYCIKLLPEDADKSPAHMRFVADAKNKAVIQAKLALKPVSAGDQEAWVVVCQLCKVTSRGDRRCNPPLRIRLAENIDSIVWHIQSRCVLTFSGFELSWDGILTVHCSRHGKLAIEAKDILFLRDESRKWY